MDAPQLFTSYWNRRDLPRVDAVKVSISRGDGRGAAFRYRKLWTLAPSRETFATENWDEFRALYLSGLESEGAQAILDALTRLSDEAGGKPLILLCHEKNPADCHRSMFAEWFEDQTGQKVEELEPGMLDGSPSQGRLW